MSQEYNAKISIEGEPLSSESNPCHTPDVADFSGEVEISDGKPAQQSILLPSTFEDNNTPNSQSALSDPLKVDQASSPTSSVVDSSVDHEDQKSGTDPHSPDEISRALLQRKQPLMELVTSEEGYVRRLRLVKDSYMPAVPTSSSSSQDASSGSMLSPVVPDDLAARWRIVWGNWIQLYEWHSGFLEKLSCLVETDPDRIPKLFIDSRARLRSIYSKYCENHRKAALIAEQYRDFFEELRLSIGDKEDVVSHLMQPVQRIMRYQLPIAEILKYTQRACSPELPLWQKALDIMKEIPKDTQLILEAARIDGFPGVITALGNILLRSDLLVATTTREQLLETVSAYKISLQECAAPMSDAIASIIRPRIPNASSAVSPVDSLGTLSIPHIASPSPPIDSAVSSDGSGLFTGNLKFIKSRLFLFEQMLLVTEENSPKRRLTTNDSFAQSTYQFKAAINVNKMRYMSHWYNCNLPSGHTNADASAIEQLLYSGLAPDDLRFAVLDQTPGRDAVYVIDPITSANREAWVVQLRDIQRMQHELLLALQDPRRFNTGGREDTWTKDTLSPELVSTDGVLPTHSSVPISVMTPQNPLVVNQQQRQRKWPSFTMRRPVRLGSNTNAGISSSGREVNLVKYTTPPTNEAQGCSNYMARSLSAERQPFVRDKLDVDSVDTPDGNTSTSRFGYRKSSHNTSSSVKSVVQFPSSKCSDVVPPDDTNQSVKGAFALKKRNVFAHLFNRGKTKHRAKPHQPQYLSSLPPHLSPHSAASTSEVTVITTAPTSADEVDVLADTPSKSKDCQNLESPESMLQLSTETTIKSAPPLPPSGTVGIFENHD